SWWHAEPRPGGLAAGWRVLELRVPAAVLDQRITLRTRAMFEGGLVEETRGLVEAGRRAALAALRAIGYDEALAALDGVLGVDEAIARTALRTRQLAKRQRTWFRHQLEGEPLDGGRPATALLAAARAAWERAPARRGAP